MKRAALAIFCLSGCGLDIVGPSEADRDVARRAEPTLPSEKAPAIDVAPPTAILTSRMEDAPAVVDLSAEGTIDWVHWTENRNRKAGANVIGDYRYVPNLLDPVKRNATPTLFKWSDGAPKKKNEVHTFESISPGRVRVTMQLPATTAKRTASFYLGGTKSTLRFEVSLSDASAPPPAPLEFSDDGGAFTRLIVEYAALREGAQLEVVYALVALRALDASLRMGAVTLQ